MGVDYVMAFFFVFVFVFCIFFAADIGGVRYKGRVCGYVQAGVNAGGGALDSSGLCGSSGSFGHVCVCVCLCVYRRTHVLLFMIYFFFLSF